MWYIYTMEYYSAIKKNELMPLSSNMDGPIDYYTKWSKSDRERQISWYHSYVESNFERYKWTYLQNSNRLTDIESQLMVTKGEVWGGGIYQELGMNTHTLLYIR